MVCVPVGEAGVTVTVQVAVPTTVCARAQAPILSAPLLELTVTVPAGVETGPLSVSVTVTVKFVPCPMAAVALSGLMLVAVARVFTVNEAVLLVAPGPLSVALIDAGRVVLHARGRAWSRLPKCRTSRWPPPCRLTN